MLKEKTENNKKLAQGRTALIGVCIAIMGIFLLIVIRHLYICNTNGRMDCSFSDFFLELGTLIFYSVLLLISIYKYDWLAPKKSTSSNWKYLLLLIMMLIVMLLYYFSG